jgi:hypothetical protein
VLSRILKSVTDRGPAGRDNEYGFGVINPYAALSAKVTATTPNAVFEGAKPLMKLATLKARTPSTKAAAGAASAPIGRVTVGKNATVLGTRFLILVAAAASLTVLSFGLVMAGLRRQPEPLAPQPL